MIVNFTVEINDETWAKMLNILTRLRFTAATIILLLILSGMLPADIPAGYYDDAEGKVGAELKAALHNIIKGHVEFPYTSSSTDVWDILKETDRDPNNANNVILLYTGRSQEKEYQDQGPSSDYTQYDGGNGTYNDSWNREHVWAKSHGDFGTTKGAGTDVHHLRPADRSVNSDRSNLDFDNGGGLHVEATGCRCDSDSWEPRDAVKGDVARMLFYMAVRYEGDNGEPDLEVVDYVTNWGYPDYPKYPIHGKLSTLLEWHANDPVDDWERNRNDIIFTYQRNRNPFIDHPEFAAWIWSDTTGPGEIANLFFSEYIEGSGYNKALEIVNASDKSVDLSDYAILSNSNNSAWNITHYSFPTDVVLSPGDVWVIAHSVADSTIRNVADDTTRASVVGFNGNDVRALVKIIESDTTFIDVIGLYNDPALEDNGWSVAGISYATKDHTIVRKSSVGQGNPDWHISAGTNADDSEWIVYDSDTFDYLGSHTITPSSLFGLCNAPARVDSYRLYPCYPNPFNPATTIRYDLHKATTVTLHVYDLRGTVVNTLVHAKQQAGNYSILWNGKDAHRRDVSAGVYLYRMQTDDGFSQTGKMILLK